MNREPEQWDEMQAEGPETATLRLLAGQDAGAGLEREGLKRAGLEQRVLARLREEADRRPGAWWRLPSQMAAGVACAALLAWGVHAGLTRKATSRAAAQPTAQPGAAPVQTRAAGSFGTAGSMRVPPTLKPLHVPAPPRRGSGQTKTGIQQKQPTENGTPKKQ